MRGFFYVYYSTLAILAMIEQTTNRIFHDLMLLWLVLISASVVFVHQHHLFDIVTGFVLALVIYRLVYEKLHNTKRA